MEKTELTTDQKLDLLLDYFRYDYLLFEIREEKNNNVRNQDFEAAVKSREKEVSLLNEMKDNNKKINDLLKTLTSHSKTDKQ